MYGGYEHRLLARAEIVARIAHQGQIDKGGVDYAEHLLAVAGMVTGSEAKAVAWLHDTVEDTPLALHDLEMLGFPAKIVDAVRLLTHTHEHDHLDYVRQIRDATTPGAELARAVKRADLAHNSDPSRPAPHWQKPESLKRRYEKAARILDGVDP